MNKLYTQIIFLISFCLMLLITRIILNESQAYLFLVWNLFLALIPLMISHYLFTRKLHYSKYKLLVISGIWVLFLPNSPYMITDFAHIIHSRPASIWLDILLLFSFAFSSLLFGLISINQMFNIFKQRWSLRIANMLLILTCFSCGFGVYLGRVLRFNSWDIITSPLSILKKSVLSYSNTTAWFMTLGFGCFLFIAVKFYSFSSSKS